MNVPQWLGLLALLAFLSSLWSLNRRMRRLESALDRLSRHVGARPPLTAEPSQRVKDLAVMPGKKIEAIRALREETGVDLKQATQIVDSLNMVQASRTRP